MRGRIATWSERLPRCEVASVSPQSSESALAGRRGCVPRRQETGGCRRQNRQYCGYFMSALTPVNDFLFLHGEEALAERGKELCDGFDRPRFSGEQNLLQVPPFNELLDD